MNSRVTLQNRGSTILYYKWLQQPSGSVLEALRKGEQYFSICINLFYVSVKDELGLGIYPRPQDFMINVSNEIIKSELIL